jgi:putative ABC transport system permease protein
MRTPRSVGRLRTASRFLLRSLDLRRSSFLLATASIAVGVSVAATAFDLKADIGRKMTRDLRAFGANLLVTAPPAGGGRSPVLTPRAIASLDSILGESPRALLSYTPVGTAAGGALVVGIGGANRARDLFSYWRVDGTWPKDEAGSGGGSPEGATTECLAGSRLASRLGLQTGSVIEVVLPGGGRSRFLVTGLVRTGESEEEQLLVPGWSPATPASTRSAPEVLMARVEGGAEVVAGAAERIRSAGLSARLIRQVSEAEGSLMGRLDLMLGLLGGLLLVLTGLCVATTLVSMVVEREPEIGLMRSLGAGDAEIVLMLMGEATLLGLAGGAIGFALGAVNARLLGWKLFGAPIAARPEVLPLVLGLSIAVCWLAAAGPLRRALRVRPSEALRGE